MAENSKKIRLKGHESFYIREGWIRKGISGIEKDPLILSANNAVDELGVGSNMVKSIRYWLQAIGLTKEERVEGGRRAQVLTEDFGRIISEGDKYIEDKFSLALMHYKLVKNEEIATSWYLFFNKISLKEFSKNSLVEIMEQKLLNINPEFEVSIKSLIDDCNCIIKTYTYDKEDLKNPEDNMICPFSELGLVDKVKVKGKEERIIKTTPRKENIDKLAVLFVIVDQLNGAKSTTIDRLIEDDFNIGKVFNLDKTIINEYLDDLELEGYIKVNRTAGLNTIYIEDTTTTDILCKYYGLG